MPSYARRADPRIKMTELNKDIFEGLKHALERGETLEHATLTFKNAGYSEEEVDYAARSLNMESVPTQPTIPKKVFTPPRKVPIQNVYVPLQSSFQQVSAYGVKPQENFLQSKGFAISLGIILLILMGVLVSLFFFKDSIIDYLNEIFVQ